MNKKQSETAVEEMTKRLIIWYETHYDYLCDSEKRLFQAILKHLEKPTVSRADGHHRRDSGLHSYNE